MKKYAYLAWDGGPGILLPADVAHLWKGALPPNVMDPKTDYGRVCVSTTNAPYAGITVGNSTALAMECPASMVAWGRSTDGLVEVYDLVGWKDTNTDALIDRATASFATSKLTDSGLKLKLSEPDALLMFAGDTPATNSFGVQRVPLPSGTYHVLVGHYTSPGEEVRVYRLKPGP